MSTVDVKQQINNNNNLQTIIRFRMSRLASVFVFHTLYILEEHLACHDVKSLFSSKFSTKQRFPESRTSFDVHEFNKSAAYGYQRSAAAVFRKF